MIENTLPHVKILYVCLNERESGDCCAHKASPAIHQKLKAAIREKGLSRQVRISRSGCQVKCSEGPNAQLFPDNIWFSNITEDDIDTILNKIIEGLPDSP